VDFSAALLEAKAGQKITRLGWNGAGQYVVAQAGYPDGIAINGNTSEALGLPVGTVVAFNPYLMIRTVDGSCAPWLASQGDLFAKDWAVYVDRPATAAAAGVLATYVPAGASTVTPTCPTCCNHDHRAGT
jgi:hypothetical protein